MSIVGTSAGGAAVGGPLELSQELADVLDELRQRRLDLSSNDLIEGVPPFIQGITNRVAQMFRYSIRTRRVMDVRSAEAAAESDLPQCPYGSEPSPIKLRWVQKYERFEYRCIHGPPPHCWEQDSRYLHPIDCGS